MAPNLPDDIARTLQPVFDLLSPTDAMSHLVVNGHRGAGGPTQHAELIALIEQKLANPAVTDRPELAAALWIYADELERSHQISQAIDSPTGAFWHAIMHRRDGDFGNSKHWYKKVGKHPAMTRIDAAGGGAGAGTDAGHYDPQQFVDRAERAFHKGEKDQPELVALQRLEWQALFEWCAEH